MRTVHTLPRPSVGVFRVLAIVLALLIAGPSFAEDDHDEQAFIGVRVANTPIPELLAVHLGLRPGEGILVADVVAGGPAAEAGVERHDVILAIDGAPVGSFEAFAEAVRAAGVGAEVHLDLIHRGNRLLVGVRLVAAPHEVLARSGAQRDPRALPPFFGPPRAGARGWPDARDPFDLAPFDFMKKLRAQDFAGSGSSSQLYVERVTRDAGQGVVTWEVTVEGDPNADDTKVIVREGDNTYQATIADLDALPTHVAKLAKEVVDRARTSMSQPADTGLGITPWFGSDLDKRVDEMKQRRQRMLDRLFSPDTASPDELLGPREPQLKL